MRPENLWVWALAASSCSHAHPTFVPHLFARALTPKCPTEKCCTLAGRNDGPREMLEAATASRETQHSGYLLECTATAAIPVVIRSPRGTSMTVHGYLDEMWARAKEEAKAVLTGIARARNVIAYSDLAARTNAISFLADDQRFFFLLREISSEEYRRPWNADSRGCSQERRLQARARVLRACARARSRCHGHGSPLGRADHASP
jgi:hypothetical protein